MPFLSLIVLSPASLGKADRMRTRSSAPREISTRSSSPCLLRVAWWRAGCGTLPAQEERLSSDGHLRVPSGSGGRGAPARAPAADTPVPSPAATSRRAPAPPSPQVSAPPVGDPPCRLCAAFRWALASASSFTRMRRHPNPLALPLLLLVARPASGARPGYTSHRLSLIPLFVDHPPCQSVLSIICNPSY